ncbi:MAG: response regulator [Nostoc sp. GBBB01]|nr:response regulator [Nostoc sp. GBBB01]
MLSLLYKRCSLVIEELPLDPSAETLYTTICERFNQEQPDALMVWGLESVVNLDGLLHATNNVRDSFRLFSFPVVLWVTDSVWSKLRRKAPDFINWASPIVEFKLSVQQQMALLRENADKAFAEQPEFSLDNAELEVLQRDLQNSGQELKSEYKATFAFILGLNYYKNSLFDKAIKQYEQSLDFWQQNHQYEQSEIILFHLILAYYLNGKQYLEETKYYIQKYLALFEQTNCPNFLGKHISKLGEVLRQLEEWEQLQLLATKALAIHQEHGNLQKMAQDYSFLAEVSLKKNLDWKESNRLALEVLKILEKTPDAEPQTWGLNYFILAQSQCKLGQIEDALTNLEKSRKKCQPQYDPNLYVEILEELRQIQFKRGEYLKAFHLKREKREIESQYRLRAFIGVGRLQPPRQVINPIAGSAGKNRDISLKDIVSSSGRQKDVEELVERIKRRDRKMTVIYGPSGVGKSSILQAAFVPTLQQTYFEGRIILPVLVQEYKNWVDKLKERLAVIINQEVGFQEHLTLVEHLHQIEKTGQLMVLIFDQFEEFFFDNKDQSSKLEFYDFLQHCLEIPYLKIIISLREDYVYCLLEISRTINLKIDKNYDYILYYLGNFSTADAEAVIKNLTASSTFPLESDLIAQLVKDLTGKLGEVRPIELQMVGMQLEAEKITKLKDYRKLGFQPQEKLVEKFLEALVKDCGEENEQAAQLLLYSLTSENNTRPIKTKAELGGDLDTEAKKLNLILEFLEDSHLILRVQGVPERYQLVHDYLVSFIRQKYQPQSLELELTKQQLKETNKRLEQQAQSLKASEDLLKSQQEELYQTNAELKEKAEQLALSSRYKTEFVANISHELRTPLNSLLILARLLADNSGGNLTDKQVEYSRTIYSAGIDVLELINDILELAKIESGILSVEIVEITFEDLQKSLELTFNQIAQNKKLSFTIELDDNLPPTITHDPKRLQQILKNLLANAFKFTEQGGVKLKISMVTQSAQLDNVGSNIPMIAFAVSDTGIGIAVEKQKIIFEAFQQADGTISRKYGGTGLGLSISCELAQLLGGRIELVSQSGQGSTFTVYLPQTYLEKRQVTQEQESRGAGGQGRQLILSPQSPVPTIADDRETIKSGDRVLLIIEDDDKFARILLEMARQQGFKVIVALQSKQGLALAQQFEPDAITLDIHMPGMDGWTILDRLKHNPKTRHIPVHIFSVDDREQRSLQLGAVTYLQKPVSPEALTQVLTEIKSFIERKVKNLLVIEDDPVQAQSIIELIGNGDVQSTAVGTGAEALLVLKSQRFDCIVLDLGLPDMSGIELIEQIKQEPSLLKLPIIVYTGKELTRQEETQLRRLAERIIIKNVRSPERLLDETALFLHRVQANLPKLKRQILEQLHQTDPVLANRKILIVDDDLRNIFALTSFLEAYQMQVLFAENGRDGIETLQVNPDINIVLMDVMMPEMDGYETTRAIRQQQEFRSLPIIALTAKAMPGDREKCIEAGASDYITKPVDSEQLLSLLRVWLYR